MQNFKPKKRAFKYATNTNAKKSKIFGSMLKKHNLYRMFFPYSIHRKDVPLHQITSHKTQHN